MRTASWARSFSSASSFASIRSMWARRASIEVARGKGLPRRRWGNADRTGERPRREQLETRRLHGLDVDVGLVAQRRRKCNSFRNLATRRDDIRRMMIVLVRVIGIEGLRRRSRLRAPPRPARARTD